MAFRESLGRVILARVFGFLNINKPAGPTSHDVVEQVRRKAGRGIKVGHAGTLDPFARGVLVICVGPATRLVSYVQDQPKRYLAHITLGATSTTDDPEGEITETTGAAVPIEQDVRRLLKDFVGEIRQVPPAHSAVHVNGRRAYKLARAGKKPDIPARTVVVHSSDLVRYEGWTVELDITCGSGTYIRALGRDVGEALGVGGYCSKLTRTAVGCFAIEQSVSPEKLDVERDLIGPLVALERVPRIGVDDPGVRRITMGQSVRCELHVLRCSDPDLLKTDTPREVLVIRGEDELIAIAEFDGETVQPEKVFARS